MRSFILATATLITSALAADYRVTLGISQITGQVGTGFDPNRILPVAGDTITFTWAVPAYIQNPQTGSHSATQGSYGSPCQPLSGGFDSGPHTTAPESSGSATQMVFQVKDTQPLYFYSSVDDQCKKGMVLGVNSAASGDGSVESYIIAAGGDPYADSSNSTSSSTTNATSSATPVHNSSTTSTTTTNSTGKSTATQSTSSPAAAARPNSAIGSIAPRAILVVLGIVVAVVAY